MVISGGSGQQWLLLGKTIDHEAGTFARPPFLWAVLMQKLGRYWDPFVQ